MQGLQAVRTPLHGICTGSPSHARFGDLAWPAMRRDLLYLGAIVLNVALLIQFEYPFALAALGPAVVVCRGSLRPLWTAPLALIAAAVVGPLVLEVLGADCPMPGMDYLNQCNARAGVAMMLLFGGLIGVQLAVLAALSALLLRAAAEAVGRWVRIS